MLDIGGVILAELNAALFSDDLDCSRDNHVQNGAKVFVNTAIDDVLAGILAKVKPGPQAVVSEKVNLLPASGSPASRSNPPKQK